MADVRELIRARIEEKGLSMSALSKDVLGKNHAYIQQFLERGIPAKLDEDDRAALAIALGVSESALKEGVKPMGKKHGTFAPAPPQAAIDGFMEVRGMAEGGPDGWQLFNGDVIDRIPRPPNLAGVPNAYAVYVIGTSMEDRYHPGELVHINPGKPVTIGAYVLVQKKPKTAGEPPMAVIKRLVRRSGNRVILEQLNPPKTFELKADEIVSMHRVVGSGEA